MIWVEQKEKVNSKKTVCVITKQVEYSEHIQFTK